MDKDLKQLLLEIQGQLILSQKTLNHIAAHQSTMLELLVRIQPEINPKTKKAVFELIKSDVNRLSEELEESVDLLGLVSIIDRYLQENP